MISAKNVDVSKMVTHRFSLQDAGKGFDMVSHYDDRVMKVMIDINT
jgi:threonine dehydrogenase-like Zn-dependent dehydrogenase